MKIYVRKLNEPFYTINSCSFHHLLLPLLIGSFLVFWKVLILQLVSMETFIELNLGCHYLNKEFTCSRLLF